MRPRTVPPPAPAPRLTRQERRRLAIEARRSPVCLNCGERTPGNFCAHCGQANDNYRVSTRRLVGDFVSDYFTVDLKFFRSVLPLLFKPGFLTSEYIAGRRARYIAPLRMYLFVSVTYFFILTITSVPERATPDSSPKRPSDEHPAKVLKPAAPVIVEDDIRADTGDPGFDRFIVERLKSKAPVLRTEKGFQAAVFAAFEAHFPKAMFFLMPVFALLRLLYVRSDRYYAEHLIFALHFHAFAFALLAIATALGGGLLPFAPLALLLYLFLALKAVFQQKTLKTAVKFSALLVGYGTAVVLAFATIVVVALLV